MKKWFVAIAILMVCSAAFAQQMPTTPVGQDAAEEGNFLMFIFEIGQWILKLLFFGLIGGAALGTGWQLWETAAPWLRGKESFGAVAIKVLVLTLLLLVVLALGVWGIGFVSDISLN